MGRNKIKKWYCVAARISNSCDNHSHDGSPSGMHWKLVTEGTKIQVVRIDDFCLSVQSDNFRGTFESTKHIKTSGLGLSNSGVLWMAV